MPACVAWEVGIHPSWSPAVDHRGDWVTGDRGGLLNCDARWGEGLRLLRLRGEASRVQG
jgi:hypothetical protein